MGDGARGWERGKTEDNLQQIQRACNVWYVDTEILVVTCQVHILRRQMMAWYEVQLMSSVAIATDCGFSEGKGNIFAKTQPSPKRP